MRVLMLPHLSAFGREETTPLRQVVTDRYIRHILCLFYLFYGDCKSSKKEQYFQKFFHHLAKLVLGDLLRVARRLHHNKRKNDCVTQVARSIVRGSMWTQFVSRVIFYVLHKEPFVPFVFDTLFGKLVGHLCWQRSIFDDIYVSNSCASDFCSYVLRFLYVLQRHARGVLFQRVFFCVQGLAYILADSIFYKDQNRNACILVGIARKRLCSFWLFLSSRLCNNFDSVSRFLLSCHSQYSISYINLHQKRFTHVSVL